MDEMEVDHVIKVTLTNEILKKISEIDEKRFSLSTIEMPPVIKNRLRKNSKKKSSYASNKIEGNPLTEKSARFFLGAMFWVFLHGSIPCTEICFGTIIYSFKYTMVYPMIMI